MANFLTSYGIFLAKSITIVISIIVTIAAIIALSTKNTKIKNNFKITKLNEYYLNLKELVSEKILDPATFKEGQKKTNKAQKKQKKLAQNQQTSDKRRIFVLNFCGDLDASGVNNLRQEITAILTVASSQDEVLVIIESQGGAVHSYGLGASQLQRLTKHNLTLTVAIDKVAASGGYLMACVANHILAAPFAIIGSIGVVAQLPNFNRLLKKHHIDFEQVTSGRYKRTLSLFGENTKIGKDKLQQEVDETHQLFKNFVAHHRPKVDLEKIATGETWYGEKAKELGLVDTLITSDDYLLKASENYELFKVEYQIKKSWREKLPSWINQLLKHANLTYPTYQ